MTATLKNLTLTRLIVYSMLLVFIEQRSVAGTVSYVGALTDANEVFIKNIAITDASIVSIQTLSYGGGVNGQGILIVPGGFDPIVTIFDSAGQFLDENDDGTCPPATEDDANCFDSTLISVLNIPGVYIFAVSVAPNFAAGSTLADGFLGIGDFAGRSQDYAVDVSVDALNDVPEPSGFLPLTIALGGIVVHEATKRLRFRCRRTQTMSVKTISASVSGDRIVDR